MPRSRVLLEALTAPQLSQEIHHILQNPNFYCQVYNSQTLVPIPRKMNSFHNVLSDFSNLYFLIRSHLRPCLPSGLFLSGFLTSMPQMPYLPHPPSINHMNNMWWGAKTTKLFIMQFSPFPHYFLPFMPNLNIFSCLFIYVISDTSSSSDYKVLRDVVAWIWHNMEWSYQGLIWHTIPKSAQTWLWVSGPDSDSGTYRTWHKTATD